MPRQFNGKMIAFSKNGAKTTRYSYVKKKLFVIKLPRTMGVHTNECIQNW